MKDAVDAVCVSVLTADNLLKFRFVLLRLFDKSCISLSLVFLACLVVNKVVLNARFEVGIGIMTSSAKPPW